MQHIKNPMKKMDYPIVVHSHLRWDWVWQRPQQFLRRICRPGQRSTNRLN